MHARDINRPPVILLMKPLLSFWPLMSSTLAALRSPWMMLHSWRYSIALATSSSTSVAAHASHPVTDVCPGPT